MEELGAADRTQAAYDKLHDDERADFVIDQKVREKKVMSLILQSRLRERLNMIWTLIAVLFMSHLKVFTVSGFWELIVTRKILS